jgi:hypothetical protein
MIRGTTAQFRYKLPYSFDEIETLTVTFWQPGKGGPSLERPLPIIKTKLHGDIEPLPGNKYVAIASLTKEETLRFATDRKAKMQLQGQTTTGIDFASKEKYITVYPVVDDSVTDDPVIHPDIDIIVLDGGPIVAEEVVL